MANIIAYIRKEQEKGNTLIDKQGNFLPEEKVNAKLKKSYLDGLKKGEIDFSKPFDSYCADEKESSYVNANEIIAKIEESLGITEPPLDMPEPVQESKVANDN